MCWQLAESIKRRLASRGEASIGGLRFGELYRRLTQRKGITNRWAVLQFLSALQDSSKIRTDTFAGSIATQENAMRLSEASSSRPPDIDLSERLNSASLENVISGALQHKGGVLNAHKKIGDGGSFEVPESVLLRDVVYAMQGIDGTYIKYDKAEDAFVVGKSHGVPNARRDLIGRICETG
jgi:gamma-tubulin complex component 3